jgi:cytochrome c-type biogenesis protein CcmF
MIPELGNFALILALCVALAQGTTASDRRAHRPATMDRPGAAGAVAQALLLAVAFGCLTTAFVQNDFSVLYVAYSIRTPCCPCSTGLPQSGAGMKARCCCG